MPEIEKHQAGDFCWVELGTSNAADAKRFYGSLFGWAAMDLSMGEMGTYTMLMRQELPLGAMYQLMEAQLQQGIPPHWMLYVAVDSVDDSVARVAELGGKVLMGAHEVPGAGRMAVLVDPAGAVFAIWEAKGHIGSRIMGEDGVLTWSELATTDASSATDFYTKFFGWGTKVSQMGPMTYTEWVNSGRSVGGMFAMTDEWKGIPPHWMPYFRVSDSDSVAAQVPQLGGTVKVPPTDIPHVGRFAVLSDPQGAVFSIIQLAA